MEEELVQLFQVANKAADAAAVREDDESRCIDALKRLKAFPVTSQMLISTQVGKGLRRLTKHPKTRIQGFASDLLQLWKKIVTEESNSCKRKEPAVAGKSNHDNVNNISMKVEDDKSIKASRDSVRGIPESGTLKARKTEENGTPSSAARASNGVQNHGKDVKVEKITRVSKPVPKPDPRKFCFPRCNDPARDKVRQILLEALSKVYSEVEEDMAAEVYGSDPGRVVASVESVMFGKWGKMNGVHKAKYRSVMFNIKDANNPDFRRKILLGHIRPERLLTMNTQEMASDQRQQENQKIQQKAMYDCELRAAPKATTDQFRCGRCGQRKCTYYQMQTRSADEPMTTYVTCVNCNNHWKFC